MYRMEAQGVDRIYVITVPVALESKILTLLRVIQMMYPNSSFNGTNQESLLIGEGSNTSCLILQW
jgi:hypothetical protein